MIADIRNFLFSELSADERARLLAIQLFSLLSACLEATTIAVFYVLVRQLLRDHNNLLDAENMQYLIPLTVSDNLTFFLVAWLCFSAIVSVASIYLINKQANYVAMSISERLMRSFLSLSYSGFYQTENIEKVKITVAEVDRLGMGVLLPLTIMVSRVFLALAILVSLFLINSLMAFSITFLVGSLYVGFYLISKSRLRLNSNRTTESIQNRFSISSKIYNGFEFLSINNGFDDLFERFQKQNKSLAKARTENNTLGQMPRFLVEFVFFLTAALLIGSAQTIEVDYIQKYIPILTAFCFGGLKLIPAAQAIFAQLAVVKTNFTTIRDVSSFFSEANKSSFKAENYEYTTSDENWLIRAQDLSLTFYDGSVGLTDVNVEIIPNCLNVISGRSGAGKSTLLRIILNLEEPTSGKMLLNTLRCNADEPSFEYVPQAVSIFDGTLRDNLILGRGNEISDDELLEVLTQAALDQFFHGLENGLETELGDGGSKISGGQKQRIGIARALLGNPDLIILDEPTSALDLENEDLIFQTLEKLAFETSILVVSHSAKFRNNANRLFTLEAGKIITR